MAKEDVYEVVGLRSVDFKGRDGDDVKGVSVYLQQALGDKEGIGMKTDKCFMASDKFAACCGGLKDVGELVGQHVQLYYNKYGKVGSFEVV